MSSEDIRREEIEAQGYEGIEMVMEYLDDVVLKMVDAGVEYTKLVARLAERYCKTRKQIFEKIIEKGQEVFPTGQDPEEEPGDEEELYLKVDADEEIVTLYPGNNYTIVIGDPEEEERNEDQI